MILQLRPVKFFRSPNLHQKPDLAYKGEKMAKSGVRPPNAPSTTGKPSGKGRGNNPPKK